jgi:hypothetical protein
MISAIKLADAFRRGGQRETANFTEAIRLGMKGEPGGVSPDEFSIKDLAGAFITEDGKPIGMNGIERIYKPSGTSLLEAGSAVSTTAFSNVTGQLLISKLLMAYQAEEFVGSRLVDTIPTRLDGEKIPGAENVSDAGNDPLTVHEAQEYPSYGFGEDYIETPSTTKRGMIIPISREAIFFDRTGFVMTRAANVGEVLGVNKEKRILDVIIGASGSNNYKRKGTSFATYYSANDSGRPYTNHLSDNTLTDWESIDAAEDLFAEMTDPNTSEPIIIGGTQLLVPPQLRTTSWRIRNATSVRSGTSNIVISGNPAPAGSLTSFSSRLLYSRLTSFSSAALAKAYWFYGDFKKAFAYMQNWPITVSKAITGSEADFTSDIVVRFKASERGAAAVLEPRAITRHRASATSSSSGS